MERNLIKPKNEIRVGFRYRLVDGQIYPGKVALADTSKHPIEVVSVDGDLVTVKYLNSEETKKVSVQVLSDPEHYEVLDESYE